MKMTRRFIVLLTLTTAFGFAADGKLAPDLVTVGANQTVDVIVRYKAQPQARHHQAIERRGGRLKRSLELLNGAAYSVTASGLQSLADDPDVDYVAPDRPVQGTLDYAEPAINASIALKYGFNGNGVTVAVIDSGIMDTHPDLQDATGKSRVVYAESFNLTEGNDYFDRYGHGTHVSGILGGDASQSSGRTYTRTFMGIAPMVKFVNLKVLDRNGAGTDSMVIAAIQRAIALKSTYNIKIINLSIGRRRSAMRIRFRPPRRRSLPR
jgi:serine protease AprX